MDIVRIIGQVLNSPVEVPVKLKTITEFVQAFGGDNKDQLLGVIQCFAPKALSEFEVNALLSVLNCLSTTTVPVQTEPDFKQATPLEFQPEVECAVVSTFHDLSLESVSTGAEKQDWMPVQYKAKATKRPMCKHGDGCVRWDCEDQHGPHRRKKCHVDYHSCRYDCNLIHEPCGCHDEKCKKFHPADKRRH